MYTRRNFLHKTLFTTASLALPLGSLVRAESKRKPNVLFIAVDDLRPQLGCYGDRGIHSPNIDRLARKGLKFEQTYCQQAICMSSRASLLSGYRPDKYGIYKNGPLYEAVPDALSLNKHFQANGYETISIGKIYHHRSDEKAGWSRPAFHPHGEWEGRGYLNEESKKIVREYTRNNPNANRKGMGPAFECADVPDNAYPDGICAEHAIKELNRLKDKSFFLAVGFVKPHLPFNAPKKYWDLYDEEDIQLPDNPFIPKGAPKEALTNWGELRGYHGMPEKGDMPDHLTRQLIHGYNACVSYTDALVGKLLDELDRLGLSENTIVILWGDHGWKLGEHSMWCKHTNFELDTHVPMMIHVPGMKTAGQSTSALTEYVDIYPTLCELCGLELPEHLEGTSMVPLLDDPKRSWKRAAFSHYPRGNAMGNSIRTKRYRYTEWRNRKNNELVAQELYDHTNDPQENVNVAGKPENRDIIKKLQKMLHEGWKKSVPK